MYSVFFSRLPKLDQKLKKSMSGFFKDELIGISMRLDIFENELKQIVLIHYNCYNKSSCINFKS